MMLQGGLRRDALGVREGRGRRPLVGGELPESPTRVQAAAAAMLA